MITVLFAPAEKKKPGGTDDPMDENALLFGLEARLPILDAYRNIITEADGSALQTLFGLKKRDDFAPFLIDLFGAATLPAVQRYDGVAYDYLQFETLEAASRGYLARHLVIFSNLFGPLRGGDRIPNYKVKQGQSVGTLAPERFYLERFSALLDAHLQDTDILDLRAGYYDKFYRPAHPVTTMKFIKEGKVVSHWAKAYRGKILRHQAIHRFDTVDALLASEIEGLVVEEILQKRQRREIVCRILS